MSKGTSSKYRAESRTVPVKEHRRGVDGIYASRKSRGTVTRNPYEVPEEAALDLECCSPECEAAPLPDKSLGIPLCGYCMMRVLEKSLAYVRKSTAKNVAKNQKAIPGPDVLDSHAPVVYYVRFQNLIKIGYTTNLRNRMSVVPHHKVLAVEPGGLAMERKRHSEFAEHRESGEWFRPGADLIAHIKSIQDKHATVRA